METLRVLGLSEKFEKASEHYYYIDILRVIAALCVLYIHTPSFYMYRNASLNVGIFIRLLFIAISSIVVPLLNFVFITITGDLLLPKNETIDVIYKKRVFRVFALLVLLSIIYVIREWLMYGKFSVSNILFYTLNLNEKSVIFWYLYLWLSILLMLFIFQSVARYIDVHPSTMIYLLIIAVLFSDILPIVNSILSKYSLHRLEMSKDLQIGLLSSRYYIFLFIGYFVGHKLCVDNNKYCSYTTLIIIFLLSVIFRVILCYVDGVNANTFPQYEYFIVFTTSTFYIMVKKLCSRIVKVSNISFIISLLAKQTLGVYVFQSLFAAYLREPFDNVVMPFVDDVMLKAPFGVFCSGDSYNLIIQLLIDIIYIMFAFISLSLITFLLRKIFVFRKVL